MKYNKKWSYRPYRPFFYEVGEPYINRIIPDVNNIHIEWCTDESVDNAEYEIYYRPRSEGEFKVCAKTSDLEYTIQDLNEKWEYEVYVKSGNKKSRTRLARCGDVVDTAVNYLHPDDEAYSYSGRFIASLSIIKHPDGYYLASMDVAQSWAPQCLSMIFRSDDDGKSWHYVTDLMPCFWGKLFMHNGDVYMLAVSAEYGDLLIGKSNDGGNTFEEPSVLMRGLGLQRGWTGMHKAPMPIIEHNGRIWITCEYGSWEKGYHAAMVGSADKDSDLLDADSWTFSEPVKYDENWKGVPKGKSKGNLEGNPVIFPDGHIYDVMRYCMDDLERKFGLICAYKVDEQNLDAPIAFDRCIEFPANNSKFTILFDEVSKKYYSIANRISDEVNIGARNLLSLLSSDDMEHWTVVKDIIDKTDCDKAKSGFQYVDWIFDGDDIAYLCRTAMNGADTFHNSNYITFGRIEKFREL